MKFGKMNYCVEYCVKDCIDVMIILCSYIFGNEVGILIVYIFLREYYLL